MNYKVFESSEKNVWKYVFELPDAIIETVLYRYEDFYKRTVICLSVMSGCPVGCRFCGSGETFVRTLKWNEIAEQVEDVLNDKGLSADINDRCEKLQFMFMSMGEPMLNWDETEKAARHLHDEYPNAQLLFSTVGIKNEKTLEKIITFSKEIDKSGLQFSIHRSTDESRNQLIPFKNKLTLDEIRQWGERWAWETGRHPYLNYCIDGTNNTQEDFDRLTVLFDPKIFCFTFSVVCSKDETMRDAGYRNLEAIYEFQAKFIEAGYNVRVFNPAGQDDIGGGCGQLWYVQEWSKRHGKQRCTSKP